MGYTVRATSDIVARQDWDTLERRVRLIDELFELSYHFLSPKQISDNV